ncbi:hypothetical protein L6164_016076 [Bauhinia variegata]|uniref:Uncharacterized protein n=1 Tax=Bauhinia variegata TaxID=167791 RepID=A0ACB9NMI4_BAUVA|nr:hypothetical protein L6164_016076 [Bauhinia variegata]
MAPRIGAMIKIQMSLYTPETIAGPKLLAGFMDAPVIGLRSSVMGYVHFKRIIVHLKKVFIFLIHGGKCDLVIVEAEAEAVYLPSNDDVKQNCNAYSNAS